MRPWQLILIGFLLSLAGWVLPFLMVIHVLTSTFFLNFFAYTISLLGFILGVIGASRYIKEHRKQ